MLIYMRLPTKAKRFALDFIKTCMIESDFTDMYIILLKRKANDQQFEE